MRAEDRVAAVAASDRHDQRKGQAPRGEGERVGTPLEIDHHQARRLVEGDRLEGAIAAR